MPVTKFNINDLVSNEEQVFLFEIGKKFRNAPKSYEKYLVTAN